MTHTDMIAKVCTAAPVIPVLTIDRVEDAQPLARALVAGGLPALEITLRTAAAMEAIAAVSEVEGAMAGVGTLLTAAQIRDAKSAGATFGVSPGATHSLIEAAREYDLPLLPGAATATEAMRLLEQGFVFQKFFPAEAAGGAPALGSMAGPLPQITFCPTGGVTPENAKTYLALPNTRCVGGSWIAPKALIDAGDWDQITQIARRAADLLA
ncbi:MAG: bifunctional 4-hydroxy-2-oxoglutarate aldolase/2-dehydro-3-deoxy-phosphogluconate aldolase [Planktomarina temperata]|jgi:2-dehydro-3-deoxyphosphogluconate aldolase/(4S)-4-hydroxy-2-oxoglutarate aldolase|uniref:bifunctional 4-hydroxy-2-oxoglutarate aldolase/2-dehydro-3-deoxy-phosphogluconate aldolase n=3 Tax=Paracoccaceae TaxID=31989 RepID=UPI000E8AD846|nr:bifunctional 4-hydroxy-2-oxoglutarate aldolase/2-dehydro-3-deoxy-phosphogluconate aldolase [Planktomarina temperata]MDB3885261.1 bifunctional 4-hydroxy-2-oxoglutarate aldolase/2-dehydro-3-deoxy-phosphogluconate aldolase [bacterium]MDG2463099.1 bifunctional 4-hydroxy-2-oxoglutarate aldolase/2-dehydro-3-deoxy-phosphogluconate aldolase [Planktomarina sp.]MDP4061734.1 KHG/KDPG aldolase [Rhodobacteraceae bacterium LE17]MBT4242717.1 bifunctional 4-hydroxy-2-oxoglutarate aldolase/2-dehydro-3-deoxy-